MSVPKHHWTALGLMQMSSTGQLHKLKEENLQEAEITSTEKAQEGDAQ